MGLKPNGDVFDEVRNFFIDGQWRYSVFTHGTDGSDAGYYEEPEGPRKSACKALAERAYQEVLKAATWLGRSSPISVQDAMAQASVKHTLELLVGLSKAKKHVPDEAHVRKVVKVLNERLGPFKHIKI